MWVCTYLVGSRKLQQTESAGDGEVIGQANIVGGGNKSIGWRSVEMDIVVFVENKCELSVIVKTSIEFAFGLDSQGRRAQILG